VNASVSRLHRVLFTFNGGYHFLDAIQTRSGRGSLCDRALSRYCVFWCRTLSINVGLLADGNGVILDTMGITILHLLGVAALYISPQPSLLPWTWL